MVLNQQGFPTVSKVGEFHILSSQDNLCLKAQICHVSSILVVNDPKCEQLLP